MTGLHVTGPVADLEMCNNNTPNMLPMSSKKTFIALAKEKDKDSKSRCLFFFLHFTAMNLQ